MKITTSFLIIILFAFSGFTNLIAQEEKNSDLFKTLKIQDSVFFERGFNQCDLNFLRSHMADNLKFYHDQSGFQDKKSFFENTEKYICSNPNKKPIRKVDSSSLEVFPLYNNGKLYGAIQKGKHSFFIIEKGIEDVKTSVAFFTHIWLLKDEKWILSDALSYNHQDPNGSKSEFASIEKMLLESKVPALGLGTIKDGEVTKIEMFGTLDKVKKAPYNTIFKVASLTKPVTAITALKLIDNGLLDLHEPLHQYWIDPDLKDDDRYKLLTPHLVLTHQTGFPNWRYMTESNKLHFQFEPGEKYQYSGEGFEYLRKAIEKKLGKTLEELADTYVFKPAGMTDTRFWWDETMDESRYAKNFDENGNLIETKKYYEANASANLLTTVEDYSRFMAYTINGAGLNPELFKAMQTEQVKLKEQDYFGYGWEILTGFSNDEFALLHTGKDPGVSTLAIMFPKSKNGYVIFLNGDNVNNIYQYLTTQKMYLGKELWDRR